MADFSIRWFEETESTNILISKDKDILADFSCYAAVRQTAGRGQQGTAWESAPGLNLTFTVLIRPEEINITGQATILHSLAVGICNYLEGKGLSATIKWPNDIYVGDRKISGTLIQNFIDGGKIAATVSGTGININQTRFSSAVPNPTSLKLETGLDYDIREELPLLLKEMYDSYLGLKSQYTRNSLESTFLSKLYRRGVWSLFEELPESHIPVEMRTGERFEGRILGTDTSNLLLIEKRNGTLKSYDVKQIKYVIPNK